MVFLCCSHDDLVNENDIDCEALFNVYSAILLMLHFQIEIFANPGLVSISS